MNQHYWRFYPRDFKVITEPVRKERPSRKIWIEVLSHLTRICEGRFSDEPGDLRVLAQLYGDSASHRAAIDDDFIGRSVQLGSNKRVCGPCGRVCGAF